MNPADGRQEVVLSIASPVNKPIRPANEAFVSFYLTVKNELAVKDTAIHIVSSGTLLEDSAGNAISDYGTTSANLYVNALKRIEIVRGTLPSASEPFKVSINSGLELNARAVFTNGDTAYVTDQVTWGSSDPKIVTALGQGSVRAAGLGTASVTATLDSVTGKHDITVYPANAPELIEPVVAYYSMTKAPTARSFAAAPVIRITVNGKPADPGRMFDQTVFVPLRSVSKLLGVGIGYDSVQKAYTAGGKTIGISYTFSGVTYVQARDICKMFGLKLALDNAKSLLSIEGSVKKN